MSYVYDGTQIRIVRPVRSISVNKQNVVVKDQQGSTLVKFANKTDSKQFLTWLYDDTKEPLTGALQEYKCLNIHDSCEAFDLCKAPFFQYQNPLLPPRLKYDKPEICSSIKLDTTYEAANVKSDQ